MSGEETNSNVSSSVTNFMSSAKNNLSHYMSEYKVQETTSHYYSVTKDTVCSLFTDHPRSKNMTYWQHMFGSMTYFLYSFGATISFLFHSIFPFMFETRGSDLTESLYIKLIADGIISRSESNNNDDEENNEENNEGNGEGNGEGKDSKADEVNNVSFSENEQEFGCEE